tara:strand:- start:1745 stop:2734 length:990 start_codon:yes stop_codon:yes gene_type:complete
MPIKKSVNKKKIYIWCSDRSRNTGEGILANKFIKDIKYCNSNIQIIIKTPKNNNINVFKERFIFPIQGLIYLWIIYISKKNKKICYINYLPLWNFLLFLFLPPKTILGPITGGSLFLKKPYFNFFLRKYFLNFFYLLSKIILKIRNKKLLFSTDLLKKKFNNNQNYYFSYVLKDLKINKKINKKKYDLIFYLRNHKNKNTDLQIRLAKKLATKFKIITVGKKIYKKNIKNFGFITRFKLLNVLKKTKYAFISSENLYSFFTIDCVKSKTNIFFNKNNKYRSKLLKGLIYLNYNDYLTLPKKIEKEIKKNYHFKIKNFKNEIKFENYFKL